jgi:hypothetical protein
MSTDEGRRALMAWEWGDDAAYEEAARRFLADALAEDEQLFAPLPGPAGHSRTLGAAESA